MLDNLAVCQAASSYHAIDVKFKWLRPIKIGNRLESEWSIETKSYPDFMKLMTSYYEDTYRLHNWVYKHQDAERHNCRNRLQPGQVILEFDYAAKAAQFQQNALSCSAARQISNFVCFAHFNPTMDDAGNNVADITEVFSFHSDCLVQDSQSIRRALTHVLQNLKDRGHLSRTCGPMGVGHRTKVENPFVICRS